jgi:hypothetical protein
MEEPVLAEFHLIRQTRETFLFFQLCFCCFILLCFCFMLNWNRRLNMELDLQNVNSESEGRQMKQCWILYEKIEKIPQKIFKKKDLQNLFGLLCTAVLIGWDPQLPPSRPHLGSYTSALLVGQDRRHLFVSPWLELTKRWFVLARESQTPSCLRALVERFWQKPEAASKICSEARLLHALEFMAVLTFK